MKYGIAFANVGPFGQPEGLAHLATTAERVGVESLWTVEHVAVPVGYESTYPYSDTGKMPGGEDSPIPDPLIWLAHAAALTEKIRLCTGILILPQRHPIYVAKELATLDVLSKGRITCGIGIGWLEEEFGALGIPFARRGARTEECVRALRQLWGSDAKPFEGEFYAWNAIESNPKPVQAGGVPIVVGGHSEGAARRAARVGDGFFPMIQGGRIDFDALKGLFDTMRSECERIGRDPGEVELTTGVPLRSVDDAKRLEDMGIARVVGGPPGFTPEQVTKGLEKLGDEILSKL